MPSHAGSQAQQPSSTAQPPWLSFDSGSAWPGHIPGIGFPFTSRWSVSRAKRWFDVVTAILTLAVAALPMAIIGVLVRLTSPGPAIFVQERVGRKGRLFLIYKFRTMESSAGNAGPGLTRGGDTRITAFGRFLRKLKLDELPQLYNVLRGDMSLVGPRPKLPRYAAIRNMPVRPGITGAASLAFCREEDALGRIHPALLEDFYHRHIRPVKAAIDLNYMARATFGSDMSIMVSTFLAFLFPRPKSATLFDKKEPVRSRSEGFLPDTPSQC